MHNEEVIPSCSFASLWFVLLFAGLASAQDWKQIPIPKLPPFNPQEPKRVELPNGMVIFLQEDHELPLIDAYGAYPRRVALGACGESGPGFALWRNVADRRHQNPDW